MPTHFADRLVEAVTRKKSPLCVGYDPRWDALPAVFRMSQGGPTAGSAPIAAPDEYRLAGSYERFFWALTDVLAPIVPVVKPQVAFFEASGRMGLDVYRAVVAHARSKGLLVIADVKRGDIASTAEAYAHAWLDDSSSPHFTGGYGPDAITASPYLGGDSLEPFFKTAEKHGKGVFVLVKTSNPGSADFQDLLVDGRPMYEHVAGRVDAWGASRVGAEGLSLVGAVVGATHPGAAARLRELMPRAVLLLPGIGAQGASPADVKACFLPGMKGALISASRHVIYAWTRSPYKERYGEARWERACEEAARDLTGEITSAI